MTNKGVERLSTVVEDVQVTFTDDKKISKVILLDNSVKIQRSGNY